MLVQVYCFVIRGVEVLNNSAVLFFNRTAKLTDKYIAICDFFFSVQPLCFFCVSLNPSLFYLEKAVSSHSIFLEFSDF